MAKQSNTSADPVAEFKSQFSTKLLKTAEDLKRTEKGLALIGNRREEEIRRHQRETIAMIAEALL